MTKRTPQIDAAIIEGFAGGRSLRGLCRQHGISRTAFLNWRLADPDLARAYEDAQLLHAEALIDDCLAIADDPLADLGDGGGVLGEALRHARFRVDARLKVARIYFKRHDDILARRAREEAERRVVWADDPEDFDDPDASGTDEEGAGYAAATPFRNGKDREPPSLGLPAAAIESVLRRTGDWP